VLCSKFFCVLIFMQLFLNVFTFYYVVNGLTVVVKRGMCYVVHFYMFIFMQLFFNVL
jgi:hypothetical protein